MTADFTIRDGMAGAFETAVLALAAEVLAKEPGVRLYQLYCDQGTGNRYRMIRSMRTPMRA